MYNSRQQYSSAETTLKQQLKQSSPATGSFCRLPGRPEERRSPRPNRGPLSKGRREKKEEEEKEEEEKEEKEEKKEFWK